MLRLDFDPLFSYAKALAMQQSREILWLQERIAELSPDVIVEIGSCWGSTLVYWAELMPRLLIGVDIYPRRDREILSERLEWCLGANGGDYIDVVGDSRKPETIEAVRNALDGRRVDFLFIDGNHEYDFVSADWENYGALVRPGGIVAFHDISPRNDRIPRGACELFRELKRRYVTEEFEDESAPESHAMGVGLVYV